jgi:hypothetical protein
MKLRDILLAERGARLAIEASKPTCNAAGNHQMINQMIKINHELSNSNMKKLQVIIK